MHVDEAVSQFGLALEKIPDAHRQQAHWLFGYVIEWFGEHGRELVASLGGRDAVVAATEAAYHKYITPIDIPGVPNFVIEPMVDNALAKAAGRLVGMAIDRMLAKG
jgi:hypothetical protein